MERTGGRNKILIVVSNNHDFFRFNDAMERFITYSTDIYGDRYFDKSVDICNTAMLSAMAGTFDLIAFMSKTPYPENIMTLVMPLMARGCRLISS
jgi:hypothetical protein